MATLVGTRPEIIKLSRVVAALERHTRHLLVHSGQNFDYELNEALFEDLDLRPPDRFLEAVGDTAADTIGLVISRFDRVLEEERPDAVLVYGDTNTALGVIAAKRRHIPVFHMEAGNRCFDPRVPEELNRRIVDHVSDVNMTNSEHARRYLLAEGVRAETVFVTGSPMREVLRHYHSRIDGSDALTRLGLTPHEYVLVSTHREENVDEPAILEDLVDTIGAVADRFGKRVLVSTHPRTQVHLAGLPSAEARLSERGIEFHKPFVFTDYVRLQEDAFCVLSDSGTLMEEAALLGFPAVMLREAHERPEGMDAGVLVFAGTKPGPVMHAIEVVTSGPRRATRVADYEPEDVSETVLRILTSYIPYVRRTVWSDHSGA